MSYDTGSNLATAGAANVGNGTINSIVSVTPITTGIFQLSFATGSPATQYTVTDPFGVSSGLLYLSGTTPGTVTSFSFTGIGLTFNIVEGSTAFNSGDTFAIFGSSIGQNVYNKAPLEATGIEVTLQRFQTTPGAPQAYWGATIQLLFNYCGSNPGVVGVIPPGLYVCDDVPRLYVQSGMTIRAYGAIICTSTTNTTGDDGFVCVASGDVVYPPIVSGVTIIGGTWGASGVNGAAQTDNSVIYRGSRTGKIFNLFVNSLTLTDVTVRGWKGGNAFSLSGDDMVLENCSFWNSDENAGIRRDTFQLREKL